MLLIFYTSYTLSMITFLGSSSSVCADEQQRRRVGSYKSFFDTIGYCIVAVVDEWWWAQLLMALLATAITWHILSFATLRRRS